MTNVTKSELIKRAAERTNLPQTTVQAVLDAALAEIAESTAAGAKVVLNGFGRFEQKERAARMGRNPQTGTPVEIAAISRLTFKAAKPKA